MVNGPTSSDDLHPLHRLDVVLDHPQDDVAGPAHRRGPSDDLSGLFEVHVAVILCIVVYTSELMYVELIL